MDVGDWLRNLGLQQYESSIHRECDRHRCAVRADGSRSGKARRRARATGNVSSRLSRRQPTAFPLLLGTGQETAPATYYAPVHSDERRHLTVMICDLVDSTAISARLDPEDMRTVMDAYHATCARITLFYDGFLADFRGDGILAIFGYPRAHEDDAERTVRAGDRYRRRCCTT